MFMEIEKFDALRKSLTTIRVTERCLQCLAKIVQQRSQRLDSWKLCVSSGRSINTEPEVECSRSTTKTSGHQLT